jgi:hypothetical protein
MAKLNEIYGGNYMKAEDIKDKGDLNVTIASVSIMEMDDGKKKAVLHFKNSEKTLPLNITNANMMEELTGSRTPRKALGLPSPTVAATASRRWWALLRMMTTATPRHERRAAIVNWRANCRQNRPRRQGTETG